MTGKAKKTTVLLFIVLLASGILNFSLLAEGETAAVKASVSTPDPYNIILKAESAESSDLVVREKEYLRIKGAPYRLSWEFIAPADICCGISIEYAKNPECRTDLYTSLSIDGKAANPETEKFLLPGFWKNSGDIHTDISGNEFAPEQAEIYDVFHKWNILDTENGGGIPLEIKLTEGRHNLTLSGEADGFLLKSITLYKISDITDYSEAAEIYRANGYRFYSGSEIAVEGEAATEKTSKSLIPLSDPSDVSVFPSDPFSGKLNYIGGSNWKMSGDTIYWDVTVPESGLYKLGIFYRQNYLMNGTSYRRLTVDGLPPFKQAEAIPFKYTGKWKMQTLCDNNGDPCLIYLTEGKHTIALSVTLGEMSEFVKRLKELTLSLGKVYREIVMITGETPDPNRDYNLFAHIPQFEERLTSIAEDIDRLIAETQRINGFRGDSNTAVLNKMKVIIEQMLKQKYKAQKKKNAFYDSYSSLSAYLYEMQNMALDIDSVILASPDTEYNRTSGGILSQALFSVKRFILSFIKDYGAVSGAETKDSVTIWINWSREQAMALSKRVSSAFTPKTGIPVNIRLTNASLLQAILSGNGPDCALSVQRTLPVNLAMRGALCNLSEFPDFDEVLSRFADSATVPYRYKNGIYALPSTQQFYMMFYRTDIFEELELRVPQTWDEFIEISSVLMMNNMQVGLPYTEITDVSQTDSGVGALSIFPTLLLQSGVELYNGELTATHLTDSPELNSVFRYWVDFYTEYDFPLSYNFFNRFRVGLMPLSIQPYGNYSTLSAAAPEINGKWEMIPIPGFVNKSGTIDRAQCGSGTGSLILEMSHCKKEAWEFLKWWSSVETQYGYASDMESIMGVSARYTTATVQALKQLGWDAETWKSLHRQWSEVKELPEIPGGYYVSRAIDQVYWNVVNLGADPEDTLLRWGLIADEEIKRKIDRYS